MKLTTVDSQFMYGYLRAQNAVKPYPSTVFVVYWQTFYFRYFCSHLMEVLISVIAA